MRRLFASSAALVAASWGGEIEVFHVNEYRTGPTPIDMDTADVVGDIFFDLRFVLMRPFACAKPVSFFALDCKNKETDSPDLVVNQLRLSVEDSSWAEYAECNLGLQGDVDPFGNPCRAGKYCCYCGKPFFRQPKPCHGTAGRLEVKTGLDYVPHGWCNESAPEWVCWQSKLNEKLPATSPGWWYSTLAAGYCPHKTGPNCSWHVSSVQKIVNKTCHKESFFASVERASPSCFEACGSRNVTSRCWTACFFRAVLGEQAGRAGGPVEGIPVPELVKMWRAPFDSEDPSLGGCLGLTPSSEPPSEAVKGTPRLPSQMAAPVGVEDSRDKDDSRWGTNSWSGSSWRSDARRGPAAEPAAKGGSGEGRGRSASVNLTALEALVV